MIIDAKGLIVGRVASLAAQKALVGEQVIIVNASKAILAGNPKNTIKDAKARQVNRVTDHGPYTPKRPAGLIKRAVRGMLPRRKPRGIDALARVKCYDGHPEGVKGEIYKVPETLKASKLGTLKRITLAEVCNIVSGPKGGRQ